MMTRHMRTDRKRQPVAIHNGENSRSLPALRETHGFAALRGRKRRSADALTLVKHPSSRRVLASGVRISCRTTRWHHR